MKLAAAKLPVTTEIIDRNSLPRLGFTNVNAINLGPNIITAGEYAKRLELANSLESVAVSLDGSHSNAKEEVVV